MGSKLKKFKKINKVLYVHRKIKRGALQDETLVPYIPDKMMPKAFEIVHTETTAGHSGYERTMKLFEKNFFNIEEKKIIKEYCENCISCTRAKATPKAVPIKKYPIHKTPFNTVSADILGPLPITSRNNQFILVIRDFTTRFTILTALQHKNADSIIEAFRKFIANFGSPRCVLTDNAREFVGEKFKNFLKFYNSRKEEVSPYHPQSQGLAERINREVNKLLRIYTNDLQLQDWDSLLETIQLTINNTFNVSLGETPFFCLFGYDSPTVSLIEPVTNYGEDDLNHHLKRIKTIRTHCRRELLKIQSQYTDYTNLKRQQKDLQIGQRIFAKLDKHHRHFKLNYPITGPFQIVDKKGQAMKIEHLESGETFIIHPDSILVRGNSRNKVTDNGKNAINIDKTITKTEKTDREVGHGYKLRPRK